MYCLWLILYDNRRVMLLQRTLYALQSLKYLLFEVLKKTLLVTGVSAYIHTSYMTGSKDFIFVSSLFFLSVVLCFLCNILHVKIQRGPHRSLCYWLMSMKNINTYLPQEITEEGWVCNNEKINRKSCMAFFGKYSFIKYMLGAFLIFWKIISLIAIFNLFIGATYTQNKIHSSQDLSFVALNIPTLLGTYHHHSSREPPHSPQLKFCIHYIPISHFLPTTLDNSICLYEPNHPRYSHTSGMLQHLTFCDWPPPYSIT